MPDGVPHNGDSIPQVTVRAPQPRARPALSPPAPPCSDQQSQVPRWKSQETPVLTCNVLLPNPSPSLATHSAFVQNSVHPQDVHLSLWDGPGPKSGSPLPPLFLDAHRCPEPEHSFFKVPTAQSFVSHLGLGMLVSSLCGGGRAEPDSQCRSPSAQGPHKDRLLTGHVTCASR